jgi:hypothetical protein
MLYLFQLKVTEFAPSSTFMDAIFASNVEGDTKMKGIPWIMRRFIRSLVTGRLVAACGGVATISAGGNRWDEKAGLRRDALSSQVIDAL